MTTCSRRINYRRLRAPKEDRAAVVEPRLEQTDALLERNLSIRQRNHCTLRGRSLAELSRQAREDLLCEARRWAAEYLDQGANDEPADSSRRESDPAAEPADSSRRKSERQPAADPTAPIFLAGHQPQLFHPGVWLKNFALGRLAAQHGATAVNLIIDSDTARSTAAVVPGGPPDRPTMETVPFDQPGPVVPYEERRIMDRALLAEFGSRALARLDGLVEQPLLEDYWARVLRRAEQTSNLGACLAQARHELERSWGLASWEVPQSRVCGSEAFCWFAAHLLVELPRFREVYNASVHEYRRVHRIRNAAQPVPDLAADGPWHEAPLWVWTAEDPRRRHVFARHASGGVVLSDREGLEVHLPVSADGDIAPAVERLRDLQRQGLKLRSRALITTLWARLALGDLFLHGIGGAKYDQVTDLIIQEFFDLAPPEYQVLSATLYLPAKRPQATRDDLRHIRQELRRLRYHPERFLDRERIVDPEGMVEDLIAEKRRWIETPQTPRNARTRCHAIRRVNEQLQPWVAEDRARLLELEAETIHALRINSILGRRDYPFCFYPAGALRELFDEIVPEG